MAKRKKTTKECGIFKENIHAALYRSTDIREMLLGDTSSMSQKQLKKEFKEHVKSHLFIDETVKETDMFIYYDVLLPDLRSNIKECKVILYMICHRNTIDEDCVKEGFHGNRVDILTEMVEDALLDEDVINEFGIGELNIDSISIYNATRFYGRIMECSVPNFR